MKNSKFLLPTILNERLRRNISKPHHVICCCHGQTATIFEPVTIFNIIQNVLIADWKKSDQFAVAPDQRTSELWREV